MEKEDWDATVEEALLGDSGQVCEDQEDVAGNKEAL
jgi:hypothetical protein